MTSADRAEAGRAAQGLEPTVTDPATIATIARVLRAAADDIEADTTKAAPTEARAAFAHFRDASTEAPVKATEERRRRGA